MAAIVATSLWAIVPLVGIGSILHFVYDWSGHHRLAAVFSAVNESYWEHVKIAVWPVAFIQLALFAFGGWMHPAFVPAATVSLYSVPITMIGTVFIYKNITKRNVLWLDIAAFAIAIAVAQVIFVLLLQQLSPDPTTVALSAIYLTGLIVAFLVFTLRPPSEPDIFVDPLTKRYGVSGHPDAGPATPEA